MNSNAMFPDKLDGAKVLFYTNQDSFGAIRYPNGEIAEYYRYLAICKYENDDQYYLFCCNENYEVVNDWVADSIAACQKTASSYKDSIVWLPTD